MIERISSFSSLQTASTFSSYANPCSDYERLNKLAYHLETDDYFLFLATLLGFVEETLTTEDSSQELTLIQLKAVRAARKDLWYLNNHCHIEPRA